MSLGFAIIPKLDLAIVKTFVALNSGGFLAEVVLKMLFLKTIQQVLNARIVFYYMHQNKDFLTQFGIFAVLGTQLFTYSIIQKCLKIVAKTLLFTSECPKPRSFISAQTLYYNDLRNNISAKMSLASSIALRHLYFYRY